MRGSQSRIKFVHHHAQVRQLAGVIARRNSTARCSHKLQATQRPVMPRVLRRALQLAHGLPQPLVEEADVPVDAIHADSDML